MEARNWFDNLIKTLSERPGSRQVIYLGRDSAEDEAWSVRSSYLGVESLPENKIGSTVGTWKVTATLGRLFVRPQDSGARQFDSKLRDWATAEPTPAPRPTPIPFSCASPSGVSVTELSYQVGDYGIGLDVNGRIANTCNEPIRISLKAVAYGDGDTILGNEDYPSWEGNCPLLTGGPGDLCLQVGESRVVSIHLFGSNFEGTARVNFETSYARM